MKIGQRRGVALPSSARALFAYAKLRVAFVTHAGLAPGGDGATPLLSTSPFGFAVIVRYRPESICLERTFTFQ